MTNDGNLTLDTFIAQVYDIDFVGTGPREAHESRVKVIRIVQHLWELLEASHRMLMKALHENRIHAEALEIALNGIESWGGDWGGDRWRITLKEARAKLAELEVQYADKK